MPMNDMQRSAVGLAPIFDHAPFVGFRRQGFAATLIPVEFATDLATHRRASRTRRSQRLRNRRGPLRLLRQHLDRQVVRHVADGRAVEDGAATRKRVQPNTRQQLRRNRP